LTISLGGSSDEARENRRDIALVHSALVMSCVTGNGRRGYGVKPQAFEGQIKSIKVDKCGMQPGTCEGSVILAKAGGGEVELAIKPGTWIKRGDQPVTIDELGVGNDVKTEAVQLPGQRLQRITVLTTA
jgi:hypothetical protein